MITRDNYQDFFLLYVDNELTATDRSMVEDWVAAHPDLQEEWESLLSCRILPEEHLVFRDKQSLLRSTGAAINGDIRDDNYPAYFLSYIDGELSDKDRLMVESFAAGFPSKRVELEQLHQTVSTPDYTIVFSDKESLYKHDRHRRVIVFYRLMAGAAAVLLAAVALLLLRTHPEQGRAFAKNIATAPASSRLPQKATAPGATAMAPNLKARASTKSAASTASTGGTPSPAHTNKKDPATVTPAAVAALYLTGDKGTVISIAKKKITPPIPANQQAVDDTKPERQENYNTDPTIVTEGLDPAGATAKQVKIPKELSSFATQALLSEDGSEKAITTTPEPSSSGKNKLRGLFRKVARTFGKTADRDTEGKREVLISAFQVVVD